MQPIDLANLVQPDRVHKSVYTDQALFDLEMEHIFEKAWVYCGHESQVKEVGQITHHADWSPTHGHGARCDRSVRVLYNRCPHRGVELCGSQSGNTGKWFCVLLPRLELSPQWQSQGHSAWSRAMTAPHEHRQRRLQHGLAARVDSYRGFVFASLSARKARA
jgi:phenylpropionate dioxygenase-like ring-hydroxylating dioxygenase large terminal subunit